MKYISDELVRETIEAMKIEVSDHLEFAGASQLAPEVNAIIEDTLRRVQSNNNNPKDLI